MGNVYVTRFKDIVKSYANKHEQFLAEIESNNSKYNTDYAIAENEKVTQKDKEACIKAKNDIDAVFREVKDYLACATYLNNSWITADKEIWFDTDYDLSLEMLKAFIERYKNNFPMLFVIKSWIARHDVTTADSPIGKYASLERDIIMPEDMLHAYKKFGDGALSMIDTIFNDISGVNRQMVDNFADESFAKDLYDIVGDGLFLSQYKTSDVPQSVHHVFDDITLYIDKISASGNMFLAQHKAQVH